MVPNDVFLATTTQRAAARKTTQRLWLPVHLQLLVLVLLVADGDHPARVLLRQGQRQGDVELPGKELVDGAAVAQVHPVADGRVLLLGLALAVDDVVVALGARDGRREPDLLVGGLFVEDVGADLGEGDVEDAGLFVW